MSVTDVTARITADPGPAGRCCPPTAPPARAPAFSSGLTRAPTVATTTATTAPPADRAVVARPHASTSASPTSGAAPTPTRAWTAPGWCSWSTTQLGYDLPRVSYDQAQAGRAGREPGRGPARRPSLAFGSPGPPRRDLHRRRPDDRGPATRPRRRRSSAVYETPTAIRRVLPGRRPVGATAPSAPARRSTARYAVRLALREGRRKLRRRPRPARRRSPRQESGYDPQRRQPGRRPGPDAADARDRAAASA